MEKKELSISKFEKIYIAGFPRYSRGFLTKSQSVNTKTGALGLN